MFVGNVTACFGGDLVKQLGKRGTESDVTLYNTKLGDSVLSFVQPSLFPDKVQSLTTALNLSQQVLLEVNALNQVFAEQLVAADLSGLKKGFLVLGADFDLDKVKPFILGTSVENYKVVDNQIASLREVLAETKAEADGSLRVQIDHSFQVKGVGTVALAVVLSGTVEKYQKLTVNPGGQIVQVKSLQVHDVDVDSAVAGLRVGLCIKDAKPEDLPRGIILSADELPTTDYLKAKLHLTKYHKKNLFAGEHYMLNTHLNYVPCIIVAGDCVPGKNCDVEIQLEKPIVESDANMLLMNPGGTIPRVFASVKL